MPTIIVAFSLLALVLEFFLETPLYRRVAPPGAPELLPGPPTLPRAYARVHKRS